MKHKLATSCIVISAMAAAVAAHAVDYDADRNHPTTFVKDSVITTKIKTRLASEHLGSVKHIRIDTDRDGVVWLSGTVNSQDEADKAVMIAHNTEGVRSVHSDLKVQKDR
jgi:hyperosmotically inducible protein